MDLFPLMKLFGDGYNVLAVAAIAWAAWTYRGKLGEGVSYLRGMVPGSTSTGKPTRENAFAAVDQLMTFFADNGCEAGIAAAREAGRCLFGGGEDAKK